MFKKSLKKSPFQYDNEKAFRIASQPAKDVYAFLGTSRAGLSEEEIDDRRKEYGENEITREQRDKGLVMFIKTFINPFIGILMGLALVSLVIDVLLAEPQERE